MVTKNRENPAFENGNQTRIEKDTTYQTFSLI